jgi:secreted Zn-dependent insulinase-like peptidase
LRPLYKHHAEDYICHVIGHEGEASLLSLLKNLQYATEIVSYTRDLLSQTLIVLEIKLTEEGGENYE